MVTGDQTKQLLFFLCISSCLFNFVHSQAVQIAAGVEHSCAILFDGRVKCWGNGAHGRLGYGDVTNRGDDPREMGNNLTAVDLGTGRTAKQVAPGYFHTCAILDDDSLKCWGSGVLGYGDNAPRGDGPGEMGDNLPVVDLGTGRSAVQVAVGTLHTCVILDDGTLKCWGFANAGQTGYGDSLTPGNQPNDMGDNLQVVNLGNSRTALQVATGDAHTCVRLDDESVKCWGAGGNSRLGHGNTTNRGSGPGEMGDNLTTVDLGAGRKAVDITTSFSHTCAVLDDGTVKCWGLASTGQLGYGDANSRGDQPGEMGDSLPAINLGTGRAAIARNVDAGLQYTCATLDNGGVKCWGFGSLGQLGTESTLTLGDNPGEMGDDLTPINLGTSKTAVQVATGATHSCALLDDSTVKCWGFGGLGALGYGDQLNRGNQLGSMGNNLPFIELLVTGSPTTSPTLAPSATPTILPTNSPTHQTQDNGIDAGLIGGVVAGTGILLAASAYLAYGKYFKGGGVDEAKQVSA